MEPRNFFPRLEPLIRNNVPALRLHGGALTFPARQ
jgi:hypothetical protein